MTQLPTSMRAAVLKAPRRIEIEELDIPSLGPRQVMLAVSYCGVCGSDLHFVLDGWGRPNSVGGHEYSGRVVAVGEEVTQWAPGDEVVGGPGPKCGDCEFCRTGRPSLCIGRSPVGEGHSDLGAFAEYTVVHQSELLRLPDGLSLRHAALVEPLAVALHALTRGGVSEGQRVLVTGAGPIGALCVAAAAARGVHDIVVSEPAPKRRALAERLGARVVMPEELVAPTSPNSVVDEPFDVALECSGRADAMEAALAQLTRAGTLVLVGAGMKAPRFDPNRILLNELVITGSFNYDADGFLVALDLLASGRLPLDDLIEPADVPLDGLLDAVVRLGEGDIPSKVMIVPSQGAT